MLNDHKVRSEIAGKTVTEMLRADEADFPSPWTMKIAEYLD